MNGAIKFFRRFIDEMEKCDIATYKHGGSSFTNYMTTLIERILEEEFSLKTEREYLRIDVIGWMDRKNEIKEDAEFWCLNPHLWDLYVAVEHENNPYDWTDEVIKMAHIRCPLKIIIGYNYCDCRDTDMEKLQTALNWMSKTNVYSSCENEALLFIFGNASAKRSRENYESFDYQGYIYADNSLKSIEL